MLRDKVSGLERERDRQGCEVLKVGEVYATLNVVVTNATNLVAGILGSEFITLSWVFIYFDVIYLSLDISL